jgi:hypothetical protein
VVYLQEKAYEQINYYTSLFSGCVFISANLGNKFLQMNSVTVVKELTFLEDRRMKVMKIFCVSMFCMFLLLAATEVWADQLMPLPDFDHTFSSSSHTRGYWFEAPCNLVITGLRVPDESGHGRQNVELVRFDGQVPPPAFPSDTNSFVSLARFVDEPSANILPVNIPVFSGDVIGVLGAAGTDTMHNSYGPAGPFVSEIFGLPVTLTRMGMQYNLYTDPAHNLWQESGGPVSRVEMWVKQQTIYCTDFERGLEGFTIDNGFGDANGLWHLTNVCESAAGEHSTPTSLYYGNDATCNYNVGIATEGAATSPVISLADVEPPVEMTFRYFLDTEGLPASYDKASVWVSADGNPFTLVAHNDPCEHVVTLVENLNWYTARVDLSAYVGSDNINIQFRFRTVDSSWNSYPGFYVDDIEITGARQQVAMPTPYNSNTAVPVETNLTWNSCVVVPRAQTDSEGNSNNIYPFDISPNPSSMRYQQLYSPDEIGRSGVITEVRFRPDGIGGSPFAPEDMEVEIYLGHSANPVSTPSTTFANNIGPGYTKDDSFAYNPATGPLLLDVKMKNSPKTTPFDFHNIGGGNVSRIWAFLVNNPTGTSASSGLVTMFCFDGASPAPAPPAPNPATASGMVAAMEEADEFGVVGRSGESSMLDSAIDSTPTSAGVALNSGGVLSGEPEVGDPAVGDGSSLPTAPIDEASSAATAEPSPPETISPEELAATRAPAAQGNEYEGTVEILTNGPGAIKVIATTGIGGSILDTLDELGYSYDYEYDFSIWDDIDLSPYDTIIIGMDGGILDGNDVAHVAAAAKAGRKLIIVGGSQYLPYAQGLDDYLIDVNSPNYFWSTVSGSPDMNVIDPGHRLATGLPKTYDFVDNDATYYMARIEDSNAQIVAENGDGYPSLVTKPIGEGWLIYFINNAHDGFWSNANDHEILKTILANALGPVCHCWDLGHPTLLPTSGFPGSNDRAVAVDINRSITVSSLDIRIGMGSAKDLTVTIRDVSGITLGPILASATVPVWPSDMGFVKVPIEFTFQAGKRYDIAFNVTGGWSTDEMEWYDFDNSILNPANGFDVGPFKVLDGRGGFTGYLNFLLPHIRACVGATTYDVYLGAGGEPMELIASNHPEPFIDPTPPGTILDSCREYFWQIVPRTCCGTQPPGPLWRFRTEVAGDITHNGITNFYDYSWMSLMWDTPSCAEPFWCDGADINFSGDVDANDYNILADDWLLICP